MGTGLAEIFDTDSIGSLPWPAGEEGRCAKEMLTPWIQQGVEAHVGNVNASVAALLVDDTVMPLTVAHRDSPGCYVASPYSQFVTYAIEHLSTVVPTSAVAPMSLGLKAFGKVLKWGQLNQTVYIDNWLVSTNLHPNLSISQLRDSIGALCKKYPGHAFAFRSVTPTLNPGLYEALKETGFQMIASRPIFYVDAREEKSFKSRMFKSDMKILEGTSYDIIHGGDFKREDIPRIRELYEALYLEKYSLGNPHLTDAFIHHVIDKDLWKFIAFKTEGRIDAVVGYYSRGDLMTSPLFGYDTQLPQELGLYRLISTALSLEAKKQGALLHQSSGAASYKKLRRAQAETEYIAVYTHHLPPLRRATWKLLQTTLNNLGKKFMS